MDQKRAPQAKCSKVVAGHPQCSNLLFLAHSKDLLKFCKAFTPFLKEPRFGQDGPKSGLCSNLLSLAHSNESFRPGKPSLRS